MHTTLLGNIWHHDNVTIVKKNPNLSLRELSLLSQEQWSLTMSKAQSASHWLPLLEWEHWLWAPVNTPDSEPVREPQPQWLSVELHFTIICNILMEWNYLCLLKVPYGLPVWIHICNRDEVWIYTNKKKILQHRIKQTIKNQSEIG